MSKLLLLFLLPLLACDAVIIRDYNYVAYEDFSSYDEFKRKFVYHDSSRPGSYLLDLDSILRCNVKHEVLFI